MDRIRPALPNCTLLTLINGLKEHGTKAVGVQFRHIEGKLWELKIKTHGGGVRHGILAFDKEKPMGDGTCERRFTYFAARAS